MKKTGIITFTFISACLLFSCKRNNMPSTQLVSGAYKDTVFTNYFRRTSGFVAGDGAYSIPVGNNQSLWVFGDSYINSYDPATGTVPCIFQVHNCALSMNIGSPAIQTTYTGTGNPAPLFNVGSNNNYWFWPAAGYSANDTLYVFLDREMKRGSSFAGVDSNYTACMPLSNLNNIKYILSGSRNGIDFSKTVILDSASGYCYVYGIKNNGFGNDVFLARFLPGAIRGPWQYYDGSGWINDPVLAAKIYSEFTASFYVVHIKQKYVMITTEFSYGCDQGKNVFATVSDNPYGPFTNHHSVWVVNDTLKGHYPFFYLANAHPEFNNGKNELLITYCINGYGTCVNTCINNRMNPDVYRPKAIRVPYYAINASLE